MPLKRHDCSLQQLFISSDYALYRSTGVRNVQMFILGLACNKLRTKK